MSKIDIVVFITVFLLSFALFYWLTNKATKRWFDGDPRKVKPEGDPQVIDSVEIGIGVKTDESD